MPFKFMFAKMLFKDDKNINMRLRFQFIMSFEKYKALHDLVPTSSLTTCVLISYMPTVYSHPGLSVPWTAQAQACLMVLS